MSKIEWTHRPGTKSEVWNPTTGCDKVSQGCKNCYAEVMHKRLRGMGQKKYKYPFLGHLQMHEDEILKPLTWKKPRTVFVNSMSDLFHKDVDFTFIDKVFAVMALTPQHTYQILTKRADRLYRYFDEGKGAMVQRWEDATYELGLSDKNDDPDAPACHVFNLCEDQWPRPNIWLGVSAENQETLDERVPFLVKVDAHVRFISYEPALGPITLGWNANNVRVDLKHGCNIHWLIAGGESGHKARPIHPQWIRDVREQCKAMGIKFFFKQWGAWETVDIFNLHQHGSDYGYFTYLDHFETVGKGKFLPQHMGHNHTDKRVPMVKVGKHKSGNVLDGVQHLEYPE